MKKILSIFLSLMLLIMSVADGFSALTLENNDSSNLDIFASNLAKMIRTYNIEDNYEEDYNQTELEQPELDLPIIYEGIENEINNFYSSGNFDVPEDEEESKDVIDFSTCRLIVKSKQKIDYMGAVDCISGYKDLFILQYKTDLDTQKAYEYYQTLDYIDYVEPDSICSAQSDDGGIPNLKPEIVVGGNVTDEALSWISEEIGFESIREELKEKVLQDVTIAVLDSGVDTDHEFLVDRLLNNDVNLSSTGEPNSCEDDYGHGTHVAGIIVDSSPDSVKIKPYKVLNYDGKGSTSLIAIAVDMAVEDGADIINLSLTAEGVHQMLEDSINEAVKQNVNVIVAAGNNSADLSKKTYSPACVESAVTVSAVDKNHKLSRYSNYNGTIDIAAPGDNVKSCYLNNTYSLMSGTSMAAPQVSAGFAIIRSVFPDKTAEEVEEMIEKYAIKMEEVSGENKYGAGILYLKYILQALPRTASVKFSVASGKFNEAFKLTLSCPEEGATILYVINGEDGVDVNFLNGTKYKSAITISNSSKVTAVAISKGKAFSLPVTYEYNRVIEKEDDKYDIDSYGMITNYVGIDMDITVPNKIRGKIVKGIAAEAFKNDHIIRSVHLPDTATKIDKNAFFGCSNLETITGNGLVEIGESAFQISTIQNIPFNQITSIGKYAFSGCNNLQNVDLSNVTTISSYAFENAKGLGEIELTNVKTVGSFAFRNSDVTKVNASTISLLNEGAFAECRSLQELTAENVITVSKSVFKECTSLVTVKLPLATTLGNDVFYNSSLKYINLPVTTKLGNNVFAGCQNLKAVSLPETEKIGTNTFRDCKAMSILHLPKLISLDYSVFSNCEQLKSLWLPQVKSVGSNAFQNTYIEYLQFDNAERISDLPTTLKGLILPTTVKSINATTPPTNYIVYGFENSYAQQYAEQVGKEFKPVPCVVFEMPQQVSVEEKFIHAYAIGYNCTYQWYKNDVVSNEGGTAIEGATKFFYEPKREDGATAYYCIITSNDGISENAFVTQPIENAFEYREADFTEYNSVIEEIGTIDRKLYTKESLEVLDNIVSVDISGCSLAEQNKVDEHVNAIKKALELLQYAFTTGDINNDGNISLVDARMVLQAVAKTITLDEIQSLASDMNGDGAITLVDARMALQTVANSTQ